ncbi:MAG: tetrahydrofolate dehydrogenase/cyclohydrolase catalytic domain-containing protein, partial [Patescibacteria group bacterium]|nr:tetrahydrofolate dehydrogenase/cyclohydrolase catalytic domain-containing protein [Patescibacteria group bacterium]
MKTIDGKKLAEKILKDVEKKIKKLPTPLGLAVILVGDDPASQIYIRKKEKACEKVGICFEKFIYTDTTDKKLITLITKLNEREDINGILIQLPLPKHLDIDKIINAIDSKKDVDGFLPESKVES